PKAERDSFPWKAPLGAALQDIAEPVRQNDLERVRAEVEQIAGRRVLTGLKGRRLGVRGVSDLLHANRVEGLAAGAGVVVRGGGERRELRGRVSYGFGDQRAKGALSAVDRRGRSALDISVYREVRDVGDAAVIAPLLNSFSSQEFGRDYGDYYLAQGGRLTYRHGIGVRSEWRATVGRESIGSRAPRGASPPRTSPRTARSCSAGVGRCSATNSAAGAVGAWACFISSGACRCRSCRLASGPTRAPLGLSPSHRTSPSAGPPLR